MLLLEAGGDDRPLKAALAIPLQRDDPRPRRLRARRSRIPRSTGSSRPSPIPGPTAAPTSGRAARCSAAPRRSTPCSTSAASAPIMTAGGRSGCEGWAWDDVLPYFRRCQHQERGDCDLHGVGGPLNVSDPTTGHEVSEAVIEACEALGLPHRDPNGAEQEGVGWYQVTIKDGKRCSAAVAYLHPAMERPNLHVETRALATRILFEGKRAVGVEFVQNGVTQVARAEAEVILAGGAINSPQLLQLSGVGPAALLREHGIEVVARSARRRRESAGPFRHRRDLPAEEGHHLGQRAGPGLPLPQRDAQISVRRKGLLTLSAAPYRRLLQVARRTSPGPTSSSTSCRRRWTRTSSPTPRRWSWRRSRA